MHISSGNGEATNMHAMVYIKNFGIYILVSLKIQVLLNFTNSSLKEYFKNLKIIKSPINAPSPPIIPAMNIFCPFPKIIKTAVAIPEVSP